MIKSKTAIAALVAGLLAAGAAFAQSGNYTEQRDGYEQERIERGVQSGQFAPRATNELQRQQARDERRAQRRLARAQARAQARGRGIERQGNGSARCGNPGRMG